MEAQGSGASGVQRRSFALKHHHSAVSVPALAVAVEWYARVFGFAVERRVTLSHIPAEVVTLRREELRIELFQVQGSAPAPAERCEPDLDLRTQGNKHFAFAVPELEPVVRELQRLQVDIVFFRQLEFATFAFIRDPAGNLIELIEQPDLWTASEQEQPAC